MNDDDNTYRVVLLGVEQFLRQVAQDSTKAAKDADAAADLVLLAVQLASQGVGR